MFAKCLSLTDAVDMFFGGLAVEQCFLCPDF